MINIAEKEIISKWCGDINTPIVSIICTTYNHEKYIENALNSFLSQITNFPFEIIIHDDASTDDTAKIIKEYEKKYPLIVKPIYEKENIYSNNMISMEEIIIQRVRGKYIALCEGDDYWIENNKLQFQYDYIENNEGVSAVVHNSSVRNIDTGETKLFNKSISNGRYIGAESILDWVISPPYHTSSVFLNTKYYVVPNEMRMSYIGDLPLALWLSLNGKIYYSNQVMSVYNKNTSNSWSTRSIANTEYQISLLSEMNGLFDLYNRKTNGKYISKIKEARLRNKASIAIKKGKTIESYFLRARCYFFYLFNKVK